MGDAPADAPLERVLVVACAALVRELRAVLDRIDPAGDAVTVVALPAPLHNRPERIPGAVAAALDEHAAGHAHAVVAYGDCGTGGRLDALLAERGVERLPGPHCYSFLAGDAVFAALAAEEPGTFFLTDFLARHADALVFGGLGLNRHPELRDLYFGNYRRVVFLSQTDDLELVAAAARTAERLGLAFEHRPVGLVPFEGAVRYLLDPAVRR